MFYDAEFFFKIFFWFSVEYVAFISFLRSIYEKKTVDLCSGMCLCDVVGTSGNRIFVITSQKTRILNDTAVRVSNVNSA